MDENDWLAERFEEQRTHLRAVAYRMLGSLAEADDAVQDAWVRVSRAETNEVENLGGWLTTIVARVCLNMLRSRNVRREESLEVHLPDPVISPWENLDQKTRPSLPTRSAWLSSSYSMLWLPLSVWPSSSMTCSTCHSRRSPPWWVDPPLPPGSWRAGHGGGLKALKSHDPDLARQRAVVDAFFLAARGGDLDALVAVLHPDVILRVDFGPSRPAASRVVRGAPASPGKRASAPIRRRCSTLR